jgi:hypothetical protein
MKERYCLMVNKRKIAAVIFLVIISLSIILYIRRTERDNLEESQDVVTETYPADRGESKEALIEEQSGDKIVTNLFFSMESIQFDDSVSEIMKAVENQSGVILSSSIGYNDQNARRIYKTGYFSVRIPKEREQDFSKNLENIGSIVSRNTSQTDITRIYTDIESRIRLLETKEQRLLELLEEATRIEDIIAIENSLNDIIYEKELLQNQIRDIDEQVEYTSVDINLLEVDRYTSQETSDTSLLERILFAFRDSFYVFRRVLELILIALMYLIPFIAVIAIVYLIVKRIKRK